MEYLLHRAGGEAEGLGIAHPAGHKQDVWFVLVLLCEFPRRGLEHLRRLIERQRQRLHTAAEVIILREIPLVVHEAEHEVVNLHVTEGVYILIDPDFIGGFQINR